MVRTIQRKRGATFQRLVLMREADYDDLRKDASAKDEPADRGKQLVETYLESDKYQDLPSSDRLAMYKRAVARDGAARQFDTSQTPAAVVASDDEDANDQAESKKPSSTTRAQDEISSTLPDVSVPPQYTNLLNSVKAMLQSSGTVAVDGQGRVYVERNLIDAESNFDKLVRSLFVQSNEGDVLPGRAMFIKHLAKIGVLAKHVSAKSAKSALKQQGGTKKRKLGKRRKALPPPPGHRPKVLYLYR